MRKKVLTRAEVVEALKTGDEIHISVWGGTHGFTHKTMQAVRCETIYWLEREHLVRRIQSKGSPLSYTLVWRQKEVENVT